MSSIKFVDLFAESDKSWDDATQIAMNKTAENVLGISSIVIKNMVAKIENNKITKFRVNAKVCFCVDETNNHGPFNIN